MADGVSWFNDGPNDFIQKMSAAPKEIDDNVGQILGEVVDEAVQNMRDRVMDGGDTKKGGPRIRSGDMYNAIDGDVTVARGRITAKFGYINGAPDYTMYQERGTRTISPLLAYAMAQEKAITKMWDQLESGRWVPASLRF